MTTPSARCSSTPSVSASPEKRATRRRGIVEARTARLPGEGDPDLGGRLCRQFMEPQGGEQTEDGVGYALGDLRERVGLGGRVAGRDVIPRACLITRPSFTRRESSAREMPCCSRSSGARGPGSRSAGAPGFCW